jgi:hypothetical protein
MKCIESLINFDSKSPFFSKVESTLVIRPKGSGHPTAYRGIPGHPGTGAGSPANSFTRPTPVRPVTTNAQIFGDFALLVP